MVYSLIIAFLFSFFLTNHPHPTLPLQKKMIKFFTDILILIRFVMMLILFIKYYWIYWIFLTILMWNFFLMLKNHNIKLQRTNYAFAVQTNVIRKSKSFKCFSRFNYSFHWIYSILNTFWVFLWMTHFCEVSVDKNTNIIFYSAVIFCILIRFYTCHYKENVSNMHFNLKIVYMWNKFICIRIFWGMNNLNIYCSIKLINANIWLWKLGRNCYNSRYPCKVNVTSKYHLNSNYFTYRKYLQNCIAC